MKYFVSKLNESCEKCDTREKHMKPQLDKCIELHKTLYFLLKRCMLLSFPNAAITCTDTDDSHFVRIFYICFDIENYTRTPRNFGFSFVYECVIICSQYNVCFHLK